VRNEEECVCSVCVCVFVCVCIRCNNLIGGKIIKEMSGSVASGTHCFTSTGNSYDLYLRDNGLESRPEHLTTVSKNLCCFPHAPFVRLGIT